MSNSFKIRGGDLVVGAGRSFERVSGVDKLAQDLRLWVTERIGTDPSTPTYGSAFDGGVIDGRQVPSFIGQLASNERLIEAKTEIISVLTQYQEMQANKMQVEMAEFNGKHTLSKDEILSTIDSVETSLVGTTIYIRVTCTTLSDRGFQIILPVTA